MSDGVNISNASFIFQQYIEASGGNAMNASDVINQFDNFNEAVNSWYNDENNQNKDNPSLFCSHVAKSLGIGDKRTENNAQYWDALNSAIMEVSNLDGDGSTLTRDDLSVRTTRATVDNSKPQEVETVQQDEAQPNNINKALDNLINGDLKDTYRSLDIASVAFDLFDCGEITEDQYYEVLSGLRNLGGDFEQIAAEESDRAELSLRLFLEDTYFGSYNGEEEGEYSAQYMAHLAEMLYNREALSDEEYQKFIGKLPIDLEAQQTVPEEQPSMPLLDEADSQDVKADDSVVVEQPIETQEEAVIEQPEEAEQAAEPVDTEAADKPDTEKTVLEFMVDEFAALVPDADKEGMANQLKEMVDKFGADCTALSNEINKALKLEGDDAQKVNDIVKAIFMNNTEDAFAGLTADDLDINVTNATVDALKPKEEEETAAVQTAEEEPAADKPDTEKTVLEFMVDEFAALVPDADKEGMAQQIKAIVDNFGNNYNALCDEINKALKLEGDDAQKVNDIVKAIFMNNTADAFAGLTADDLEVNVTNATADALKSEEVSEQTETQAPAEDKPQQVESEAQSTTEIMAQKFASLISGADALQIAKTIENFIENNGLSYALADELAGEIGLSDAKPVQDMVIQIMQAIGETDPEAVLTLDDVQAADTAALNEILKVDETVSPAAEETQETQQTPAAAVQQVQTVNMQTQELYAAAHHVVDTNSWKRNDPNNAQWKDAKEQFAKALTGGADLSACFDEQGNCTPEFTKYLQELADKYSDQINLHLPPKEKVTAESSAEDILYAFMKNSVYGHSYENSFEITGMQAQAAASAEASLQVHNPFELKGKGWSRYNGCHYDAATGEAWLTGQWWSADGSAIFTTPANIIKYCYGVEPGDPDFDLIYNTLNELNDNRFTSPTESSGIGGQRINLMSYDAFEKKAAEQTTQKTATDTEAADGTTLAQDTTFNLDNYVYYRDGNSATISKDQARENLLDDIAKVYGLVKGADGKYDEALLERIYDAIMAANNIELLHGNDTKLDAILRMGNDGKGENDIIKIPKL